MLVGHEMTITNSALQYASMDTFHPMLLSSCLQYFTTYRVPHEDIDVSIKTPIHVLSDIEVNKVTKVVIQVDA